MFTRDTGHSSFDSVACVSATVKRHPYAHETPNVEITMTYVGKESQTTYGTCQVLTQMLSQETLVHLKAFLDSAEKDFGQVVFGSGQMAFNTSAPKFPGSVETNEGLRRGIGETQGVGGTNGRA